MKKLRFLFTVVFLIAAMVSCDKKTLETIPVSAPSEFGIMPIAYGGNQTCEDLIGEFPGGSTGRIDYDDGEFQGEWPDGLTVTVKDDSVSFEIDPNLFSFCVGAVIVKGGNAANVYYYDPGVKSDKGLTAPINASGKPAGLSNLTFCFVECPPQLVICFKTYLTYPDLVNPYAVMGGIDSENSYLKLGYNNYVFGIENVYPLNLMFDGGQIGTITASDFWKDNAEGISTHYIKVVVDTYNDAYDFKWSYLYIGSLSGLNVYRPVQADGRYKVNFAAFPFYLGPVADPRIFEIPLSSITQ